MAFLNKAGLEQLWKHITAKLNNKADKAYVNEAISDLVNSAPETLDTLGELATAMQDNASVIETLDAAITNKVDKVEGKGLSTNDFTDAEKEKLASAVLSVGGIAPNAEGNVPLSLVKNVTIVDGSAISPDILQYMGVNTMAEIVGWLRNKGTHSVIFHRDVKDVNGKTVEVVKDTGSNILRQEDGTYNAIVYFGDDLCPIILDSNNNKIYFDPDWVAPAQSVKSINGITPDENGRLNTVVIIENDESTGNISIIRNPDLLWLALQSDLSASDISIFQRVAYEEDNSQDYLMINNELESLVFSQTDEIVVEIWRLGFGGHAPDLLVDNIAHTVTLDPDWVAPAEPITELVQADWNENDETSDAYVKNRTHYKTYEVTTFIDDEAFPFDYFGMGFGTLPVELEFKVGETYTVVWEGTTYECVCKEDDAKYVGNFSILKYTAENTGEPFLITPLAVTTKAAGTSHSIKATGPLAVYHKIDEKYLPDSVVKSVNNILPDENGNVELEIATDDDILALMMEVDALPVVMDESGAIMTDEEGAILLA